MKVNSLKKKSQVTIAYSHPMSFSGAGYLALRHRPRGLSIDDVLTVSQTCRYRHDDYLRCRLGVKYLKLLITINKFIDSAPGFEPKLVVYIGLKQRFLNFFFLIDHFQNFT